MKENVSGCFLSDHSV